MTMDYYSIGRSPCSTSSMYSSKHGSSCAFLFCILYYTILTPNCSAVYIAWIQTDMHADALAKRSRDVDGRSNESEFWGQWRQRFLVPILQRSNPKVMLQHASCLGSFVQKPMKTRQTCTEILRTICTSLPLMKYFTYRWTMLVLA